MKLLARIKHWLIERTIGAVYETTGTTAEWQPSVYDDHVVFYGRCGDPSSMYTQPLRNGGVYHREFGTPNLLHIVEVTD